MEGANEEVGPRIGPTRRFRRLQHILIAIALILLVALIALWIARKSLSVDAMDRALA